MAVFVPDNSTMLSAWGGFLPCTVTSDCVLDSRSIYSYMINCSPMTNSPKPLQDYCHCDLGLGGEDCTDITTSGVFKLWLQLFGLLLSLAVTSFGIFEIYERRKPDSKFYGICLGSCVGRSLNSVVVSLHIAVVGCLAIVGWNFWGGLFILVPSSDWNITFMHAVYFTTFIPGSVVMPLCSVLVISLAWRKVVIEWDLYKKHVDSVAMEQREARVRKVVLGCCSLLFITSAIFIMLGRLSYASTEALIAYALSLVFFIQGNRRFAAHFGSTVDEISGSGHSSTMLRCLKAARDANRNATIGVIVTLLALGFMAVAHRVIGYPSQPDEIWISGLAHLFIQIGCLITSMVSILYAKDARLTAGGTRSQKQNTTNGSKRTGTVGTGEGGLSHMDKAFLSESDFLGSNPRYTL